MEKRKTGLFVNFQDYSVHDGSGLRCLVFLKGCPLRCRWCQNPECIKPGKEVVFRERLCIGCGRCVEACPVGAISEDGYRIDLSKCTYCGKCADVCPPGALKIAGTEISVEQLVKHIASYEEFYKASDQGGVTISGGDPVFQLDFVIDVLKACQERGIHTAIETSAYAAEEDFVRLISHVDLLLCDIKHMDEAKHIEGTRVSNRLILNNLKRWSQLPNRPDCIIRIPLIPGYNDDKENIFNTCQFVKGLGIKQIDLLPFNDMAVSKYNEVGVKWEYSGVSRQEESRLSELHDVVEATGLDVTIGGLW